ncbi:MAG: hypothetical protein MJZ76_05770 [Bacteroidales bacterium]|nr:hypothetical protein [Bacteroidales bacterium]
MKKTLLILALVFGFVLVQAQEKQENEKTSNYITGYGNSNWKEVVDAISSTKIAFEVDKEQPRISNEDGIDNLVKVLKKDNSFVLVITTSSKSASKDLADKRAKATKDYFVNKGVPADQVEIENDDKAEMPSQAEGCAAILRIRTK